MNSSLNKASVLETKEIYRTPGYQSRRDSPGKGYGANYKSHKRLKSPNRYDNSGPTLQSTAVRDTTDLSKLSGSKFETPNFSPSQHGSVQKLNTYTRSGRSSRGSRSRSRSSSRCKTKPKFKIIEDDKLQVMDPSTQPQVRRSSKSPNRRMSPSRSRG
jgi:hypothetical protein